MSCGLALRAEALAHVLLNQREASEGQVPAHHHHSHVCSAVQCSERGGHLRLPMPMTSQGAEGLLWARGERQEARLLGVPDRDSGRHCAAGEETRWRS